ncbi:MAG TPA: GDP-mannose 4,6-dehydratase [Gemmatimonadales bacterium]
MTVLVTGANGFVGRWVIRALLAAGHSVVAASGPGGATPGTGLDSAERAQVRWVSLDLADLASVRAATAGSFDAVLHLAGLASGGDALKDPGLAWMINAAGTARLMDELGRRRMHGGSDPMVVVASTAEVYGRSMKPLVETDAIAPCSPYAASKRGSELAAAETAARTGLRVVIARAFPHTGPGQDSRFVAPAFAQRLAMAKQAGARVVNVGNLEVTRDFLDVRDVAQAYLSLLVKGKPGEIYNVASGRPLTLRALFDQLAEIVGVDAIPECDAAFMRPADIPYLVGNSGRLRVATGWEPAIPFASTLQDLVHAQAS